ncbi:MAG: Bug family tripartite tricarboxylate transporter substrate binding protein [Burkholderiales bacterium]
MLRIVRAAIRVIGVICVTAPSLLLVLSAAAVAADTYPSRSLRIVAPYGAGGSYDIVSRILAQTLSQQLGQQIVLENRPGATGRIGMEVGVKATPDGYTMIVIGSSQAIAPSVHLSVPYDLAKSIMPIMLHGTISYALVIHPSVPAQTVAEFVALSKAKPGSLRYGSGGTGGITHLAGELFNNLTGADIAHVPYKSGALATNALLGNEVQMNLLNMLNVLPHVQGGRIRGLAVTGLKRSQYLPNLPTLDESGARGYEMIEFHGFAFPAGTPREIVSRMNGEMVKALKTDDLKQRLSQQAFEPSITTPEEFGAYLLNEQAKYAKIVKAIGLKPEG